MLTPIEDLKPVQALHRRAYSFEVLEGQEWKPMDPLVLFRKAAFLGEEKLSNIKYSTALDVLRFSGERFRAAVDFFDNSLFFLGEISDLNGETRLVRGASRPVVFATWVSGTNITGRKAWRPLILETYFDENLPKYKFFLGEPGSSLQQPYQEHCDITDRVAVSSADDEWEIKLWLSPSSGNIFPGPADPDQCAFEQEFDITIAWDGSSFEGTYTDHINSSEYIWKGEAQISRSGEFSAVSKNMYLRLETAYKKSAMKTAYKKSAMKTDRFARTSFSVQDTSGLTILDLINISPYKSYSTEIGGKSGTETVDVAQKGAVLYFQSLLLNALDPSWFGRFFARRRHVPENVRQVGEKYKDFYESHAVKNLGLILRQTILDTDPILGRAVKRISEEKLDDAWKEAAKDDDYQKQFEELYFAAYENEVQELRPYLKKPEHWADQLYELLDSDHFQAKIMLEYQCLTCKNPGAFVLQIFNKLRILDPDGDERRAEAMTKFEFLFILARTRDGVYDGEFEPILDKLFEAMLNGNYVDFSEEHQGILQEYADDLRRFAEFHRLATGELISQRISQFLIRRGQTDLLQSIPHFVANEFELIEMQSVNFPEKMKNKWLNFKTKYLDMTQISNAFQSLVWVGAAVSAIWYAHGGKTVDGIGDVLSIASLYGIALGSLVRATQSLALNGLLKLWAEHALKKGAEGVARSLTEMNKWLTEGFQNPQGATKIFVKIFGKSAAKFLLGLTALLAVVGVSLAVIWAIESWQIGRTGDVIGATLFAVFTAVEAAVKIIGLFVTISATVAMIGAIAMGLAVATLAIKLVWDLFIDKPEPPLHPVEEFIIGPLADEGLVT